MFGFKDIDTLVLESKVDKSFIVTLLESSLPGHVRNNDEKGLLDMLKASRPDLRGESLEKILKDWPVALTKFSALYVLVALADMRKNEANQKFTRHEQGQDKVGEKQEMREGEEEKRERSTVDCLLALQGVEAEVTEKDSLLLQRCAALGAMHRSCEKMAQALEEGELKREARLLLEERLEYIASLEHVSEFELLCLTQSATVLPALYACLEKPSRIAGIVSTCGSVEVRKKLERLLVKEIEVDEEEQERERLLEQWGESEWPESVARDWKGFVDCIIEGVFEAPKKKWMLWLAFDSLQKLSLLSSHLALLRSKLKEIHGSFLRHGPSPDTHNSSYFLGKILSHVYDLHSVASARFLRDYREHVHSSPTKVLAAHTLYVEEMMSCFTPEVWKSLETLDWTRFVQSLKTAAVHHNSSSVLLFSLFQQ